MTTVEDTVQQVDNFDAFLYFEGGREGVQRRFGELIKKGLERIPYSAVINLCDASNLDPQIIYKVNRGDYSVVKRDLVKAFSMAFEFSELKFDFELSLGEPIISEADKRTLVGRMQEDRFICTLPDLTDDQRIWQYLSSCAASQF